MISTLAGQDRARLTVVLKGQTRTIFRSTRPDCRHRYETGDHQADDQVDPRQGQLIDQYCSGGKGKQRGQQSDEAVFRPVSLIRPGGRARTAPSADYTALAMIN
jgi:hypothetical protein